MKAKRWSSWLAQAVRTGKFSRAAKLAAENWVTCAVGETYGDCDPTGAMEKLGMKFYRAVEKDRVATAVQVYGQIKDGA